MCLWLDAQLLPLLVANPLQDRQVAVLFTARLLQELPFQALDLEADRERRGVGQRVADRRLVGS